MPNCTTRQTRQTNISKLLKTERFVPRSYSRFQFCSRASAGLIILSTVACSIRTAPAQSSDIAAAQQCLAGFTSPKSDEELIVNIQKAWASNTFAKDCLYSEENLHRLFGGTEVQWNEQGGTVRAGRIYGYLQWEPIGTREEVEVVGFSMMRRLGRNPRVEVLIHFNNDIDLQYDYVTSVFGSGWRPMATPPPLDITLFGQAVPATTPHGNDRIFYRSLDGNVLNLLFSPRGNLYSLEIREN